MKTVATMGVICKSLRPHGWGGLLVCIMLIATPVQAVEHFTIGKQVRPWAVWGEFDALDAVSQPGWIQPRRTEFEVNILQQLLGNGQLYTGKNPPSDSYRPGVDGRIWSLNVPITEEHTLLRLMDGLSDSLAFDYFDRLASNNGVVFFIDLGIPFPVSQISFYPLSFGTHPELFVRGYELFGNDGAPDKVDKLGEPIYTLLDAESDNIDVVVRNSRFAAQHLRYIKFRITSPQPLELDQLEIRGEGYVRRAVFVSDIIDLEDLTNLGPVVWNSRKDPGSLLHIQSRVRASEAVQWTPWSEPYAASGQVLSSAGPARFVQWQVVMETQVTEGRAQLDSLSFAFSRPVLGRQIAAEISPRQEVQLGTEQRFSYVIKSTIAAEDKGFDRIEIFTPTRAQLQQVYLGERELSLTAYQVETQEHVLTVELLEERIVQSGQDVRLVFDTSVLIYGTRVGGRVWASWDADLLPQWIEAGREEALTVRGATSSLGQVVSEPAVLPPVFTPNGDGINDAATITFRLSQVLGDAPLQVRVFDLSGRQVVALLERAVESASFRVQWDGRDAAAQLVPPGFYIYQIALQGDAADFVRSGTVGVAY